MYVSERIMEGLTGIIRNQAGGDDSIMVDEKMRLKEDLGFDSLRLVGLLLEIEEKMEVTFDESDLDPAVLLLVGDLAALVEKQQAGGG